MQTMETNTCSSALAALYMTVNMIWGSIQHMLWLISYTNQSLNFSSDPVLYLTLTLTQIKCRVTDFGCGSGQKSSVRTHSIKNHPLIWNGIIGTSTFVYSSKFCGSSRSQVKWSLLPIRLLGWQHHMGWDWLIEFHLTVWGFVLGETKEYGVEHAEWVKEKKIGLC